MQIRLTVASACITATTDIVIVSEYGVRAVFMQNHSNGSAGLNRFWAPFSHPLATATLQCNNALLYYLSFCTSKTVSCSVMCTFTLTHILYININYHLPTIYTHNMYDIVRIHPMWYTPPITTHSDIYLSVFH